jgi:hypothetical protein
MAKQTSHPHQVPAAVGPDRVQVSADSLGAVGLGPGPHFPYPEQPPAQVFAQVPSIWGETSKQVAEG